MLDGGIRLAHSLLCTPFCHFLTCTYREMENKYVEQLTHHTHTSLYLTFHLLVHNKTASIETVPRAIICWKPLI